MFLIVTNFVELAKGQILEPSITCESALNLYLLAENGSAKKPLSKRWLRSQSTGFSVFSKDKKEIIRIFPWYGVNYKWIKSISNGDKIEVHGQEIKLFLSKNLELICEKSIID